MIFWDSSAIVAILLEEPATGRLREVSRADNTLIVWWETPIECLSAIARREREGSIAFDDADRARERLDTLAASWNEVLASEELRDHARRLLLRHPLRSADVLQLAAAMTWARGRPRGHRFCALDDRLADSARSEGFRVLDDH